ncbi:MAG: hypothetical protein WA871_03000 [Candidatus Acidiferrales bacterium]
MFCPNCKAEYLPGVKHCSDCDVDLVENLPAPGGGPAETLSDADLRSVWGGEDQEEFASVCAQLKGAEIPFRVNQRAREWVTGLGQYFEIGVPANRYEQAKEIVGGDGTGNASAIELPAEDDEPEPTESTEEWESKAWFPEDASAEIWSGKGEERASMIEASLRENNIRARTEIAGNGAGKVFVVPDDEARAKEIVREIDDATPPK